MKAREQFQKFSSATVLLILLISTSIAGQNPAPSAPAGQAGNQDDVVRVETNLVTIPATVMDRDGRYVIDLRKEDFQIFEDGMEQEVAFFAPVEQPFTILFLLDTSPSMTYRMEDLARAANAFVNQLRPDDQLIAASFCENVRVLSEATSVREVRGNQNLRLRTCPNTKLYDAVDYALKRMKRVRGRKAIVLFSDGYGSGIFSTARGNLHDAEEQDALIYTIQFDTLPAEPPRYVNREDYFRRIEEINGYMRDLAQKTGGRHYRVENISDLERTFGMVAEELRRQYSLGYYPMRRLESGQRRQIRVNVRLPNLVVRARDSYLVEPSRRTRRQ